MKRNFVRSWEGGYVKKDAVGNDVYIIRRMLKGKRYHVSTRVIRRGRPLSS